MGQQNENKEIPNATIQEHELARLLRIRISADLTQFEQEDLLALGRQTKAGGSISRGQGWNDESTAADSGDELRHLIELLDPPLENGELARLGDYRLIELLGLGGMGIVFRAEDAKLGRSVAIKFIRPLRLRAANAAEHFLNEARAAAKLTHDNIVTVHHVGQHGELPYSVMQLLAGQSLADRLRQLGPIAVGSALNLTRQIALALSAAHAQNIVHCDIKPDNIWLEESTDRVKILDFGLARLTIPDLDSDDERMLAGTPNYMSPERICGEPGKPSADLYSLGVVLYEMLSGIRPFQAADTTQILKRGIHWEPRALTEFSKTENSIDSAISQLVDDLLEKDPSRRPASASELIERIDAIEKNSKTDSDNARATKPLRRNWLVWTSLLMAISAIAFAISRRPSQDANPIENAANAAVVARY